MPGRRFKTAFILGAGLGMRLRPLTEHCPKPLLEIGGRPLITYAMDPLLGIGVDRFIVNTHHCPEAYLRKFPDRQWKNRPIFFRYEPVLLDSAGGLKNIEDLLEGDQTSLCYNADALTNLPLQKLLQMHTERQPEATLVLRTSGHPLNVCVNEQNEICDIRHILKRPGALCCLFAGIYAVETSLLRNIEPGKPASIITTFLQAITHRPGSILGAVIDQGCWQSPDSVEDYERMKSDKHFRTECWKEAPASGE